MAAGRSTRSSLRTNLGEPIPRAARRNQGPSGPTHRPMYRLMDRGADPAQRQATCSTARRHGGISPPRPDEVQGRGISCLRLGISPAVAWSNGSCSVTSADPGHGQVQISTSAVPTDPGRDQRRRFKGLTTGEVRALPPARIEPERGDTPTGSSREGGRSGRCWRYGTRDVRTVEQGSTDSVGNAGA